MILKKIQGTHMDPADWIETYIIEVEFLNDDELLEVTPESLRLRKRILSKELRMKQQFRKK